MKPSKESVVEVSTNLKQISSSEQATSLAKQVLDDPCILMGGCSFNAFEARIEEALRHYAAEAVLREREECALVVDSYVEAFDLAVVQGIAYEIRKRT